jgi:hypothetical protein
MELPAGVLRRRELFRSRPVCGWRPTDPGPSADDHAWLPPKNALIASTGPAGWRAGLETATTRSRPRPGVHENWCSVATTGDVGLWSPLRRARQLDSCRPPLLRRLYNFRLAVLLEGIFAVCDPSRPALDDIGRVLGPWRPRPHRRRRLATLAGTSKRNGTPALGRHGSRRSPSSGARRAAVTAMPSWISTWASEAHPILNPCERGDVAFSGLSRQKCQDRSGLGIVYKRPCDRGHQRSFATTRRGTRYTQARSGSYLGRTRQAEALLTIGA